MKAIFIGSVEFSLGLLDVVKNSPLIDIVGLVTKETSTFNSDFADLSKSFKGQECPEVFYFKNNSEEMSSWIQQKAPDVIFCLGWSHLLPEAALKIPPKGAIGYHPAALPSNRGRHPIIWALCLGLKTTASTFFLIKPGVDEGDILSQMNVPILESDYAQDLYNKLKVAAISQLKDLIEELVNNRVQPKSQEHLPSNFWRKRSKEDGRIDWRMSARSIYNLVRALAPPYPGAFFQWDESAVPVNRSQIISAAGLENRIPGEVIECTDVHIDIKTGDDLIRIEFNGIDTTIKKGDFL